MGVPVGHESFFLKGRWQPPFFNYRHDDFDFFGFAEHCTKNQNLSGETNSGLTVSLGCTSLHPNRLTPTSLNRICYTQLTSGN